MFFIGGDRGTFRARTSGRLYLGVNDDYLQDNSGSSASSSSTRS